MNVTREVEFEATPEEVWSAITSRSSSSNGSRTRSSSTPVPAAGPYSAGTTARSAPPWWTRWTRSASSASGGMTAAPCVLELEETLDGTRLIVVESSPEFSTALALQALACQTA